MAENIITKQANKKLSTNTSDSEDEGLSEQSSRSNVDLPPPTPRELRAHKRCASIDARSECSQAASSLSESRRPNYKEGHENLSCISIKDVYKLCDRISVGKKTLVIGYIESILEKNGRTATNT